MTENITILLSRSITQEEKINAANHIITNYNLNLTTKEILLVFHKAKYEIRSEYYSSKLVHYKFLFEFLLNQNICMFIAITKCCSDYKKNKTYWPLSLCVSSWEPFYVGINYSYNACFAISTYKNFLNYHNFNIDNLTMLSQCKKKIEEYRNEKYGGSLTKAAKK